MMTSEEMVAIAQLEGLLLQLKGKLNTQEALEQFAQICEEQAQVAFEEVEAWDEAA